MGCALRMAVCCYGWVRHDPHAARENGHSMSDLRERALDAVEPGMEVETTEGDLGERDITKPVVKDVVRDPGGDVEKVIVEKGAVFKKELAVPADRV